MTEKIRLKDNTEFTIIPNGIDTRDKYRIIKFISELPFEELKAKFSKTNIERIDYILADETTGATYEDCVALKSLTYVPNVQVDDNTISDIYIAVLSTDAVERQLKMTQSSIDTTIMAVDILFTEILPMLTL